jgi:serine/threonine protein kinase
MPANATTHLSPDVLRALGSGTLDAAASASVLAHLDGCLECRQAGGALMGASFVQRIRAARPPIGTLVEALTPAETASSVPPPILPATTPCAGPTVLPELRDHPQYEVLRELGRGGMGVVYLARNKLMDRPEVLKVVNKRILDQPETAERFLREIRAAAKLSHASIVTAYSAVRAGDLLAFAMEYVEGEDLEKVVQTQGPLPVANACYYTLQVAQGLQHAFDKGLVHRDIKPQNLILAREGKKHVVKILDFGLAKATREGKEADRGLTGTGMMMGTPDYIAPEQTLDAARADIRADIYSLGCTLYFLLTGRPPFQAKSQFELLQAHHSKDATPLDQLRKDVPVELAAIVAKMMAKDPALRYQKPVEVAQALGPFAKPGIKPTAPAPVQPAQAALVKTVVESNPTGTRTEKQAATPALEGTVIEVCPEMPRATKDTATPQKSPGRRRRANEDGKKRRQSANTKAGLLSPWAIGSMAVLGLLGAVTVLIVFASRGSISSRAALNSGFGSMSSAGQGSHDAQSSPMGGASGKVTSAGIDQPQGSAGETAWKSLFNGKDLTGWTVDGGQASQWSVAGGAIVGQSSDFNSRNYLLSSKDYSDFTLRFDFKVESKSHGAVALRAIAGEKNMPGAGFDHPMIKLVNPARAATEPTGTTHWLKSAAMNVGPLEIPALPSATWHTMEVDVREDRCTAKVNGRLLVDLTFDPNGPKTAGFVPGLKRVAGKVGFQINTGKVSYRKIEIME